MSKDTKKESREAAYRRILAEGGLRLEDCRVLAFVFEDERKPETFHLWLMLDERKPQYHIFDCSGKTATVVAPKYTAGEDIITDIARRAGGQQTTPNLK